MQGDLQLQNQHRATESIKLAQNDGVVVSVPRGDKNSRLTVVFSELSICYNLSFYHMPEPPILKQKAETWERELSEIPIEGIKRSFQHARKKVGMPLINNVFQSWNEVIKPAMMMENKNFKIIDGQRIKAEILAKLMETAEGFGAQKMENAQNELKRRVGQVDWENLKMNHEDDAMDYLIKLEIQNG